MNRTRVRIVGASIWLLTRLSSTILSTGPTNGLLFMIEVIRWRTLDCADRGHTG